MNSIEVLMSAMHQKDMSIAKRSNVQTDILIINQCDKDGYDEEIYNGHRIRMISTTERGASKSRNMAVENAKGDICVMSDDDEAFADGYPKAILKAYEEKPDADIIAFNVRHLNPRGKKKYIRSFRLSPRMKSYGTWNITFKRSSILKAGIKFNEAFGPGSGKIASGEDSVWCRDAVKSGMRIYQHPFYIASVSQTETTWFTGYDEQFFYDRGAFLRQVMPVSGRLIKYYYVYRYWGKSELPLSKQIQWMNTGIREFGKGLSYKEYVKGTN